MTTQDAPKPGLETAKAPLGAVVVAMLVAWLCWHRLVAMRAQLTRLQAVPGARDGACGYADGAGCGVVRLPLQQREAKRLGSSGVWGHARVGKGAGELGGGHLLGARRIHRDGWLSGQWMTHYRIAQLAANHISSVIADQRLYFRQRPAMSIFSGPACVKCSAVSQAYTRHPSIGGLYSANRFDRRGHGAMYCIGAVLVRAHLISPRFRDRQSITVTASYH